jgi:hypothetical protein
MKTTLNSRLNNVPLSKCRGHYYTTLLRMFNQFSMAITSTASIGILFWKLRNCKDQDKGTGKARNRDNMNVFLIKLPLHTLKEVSTRWIKSSPKKTLYDALLVTFSVNTRTYLMANRCHTRGRKPVDPETMSQ